MFKTNTLLYLATLAAVSVAQDGPGPEACSSSQSVLIAGAKPPPNTLAPYLSALGYGTPTASGEPAPITTMVSTLEDPQKYEQALCEAGAELPASLLPAFQSWGQGLLAYGSMHLEEYDDFVTKCVTTGPKATSIISYLNEMLTGTEQRCKPTSAPTSTDVPATPTPTTMGANSTITTATGSMITTSASMIPTAAAAARPTAMIAGVVAAGGIVGALL
ncbi:hypothetical protein F4808DRAFT_464817 [Astrocystis sublimbata]|nr:hypothetical protein F4808DRAFT_464817 [Astrocystis sublimbata]